MSRIIFVFLLSVLSLLSCSSPKKVSTSATASSNDGLSYATAVFITEKTESTGVNAEYKWIKEHYSNYKIKGQSLTTHDKKPYDIITILLSDGKELPLYFDISNYFGKF
ncbi:MAG TPA: hypothetical protein VKT28_21130 [Puia sp.]|nr:hypothetical protein [Puia sp.]